MDQGKTLLSRLQVLLTKQRHLQIEDTHTKQWKLSPWLQWPLALIGGAFVLVFALALVWGVISELLAFIPGVIAAAWVAVITSWHYMTNLSVQALLYIIVFLLILVLLELKGIKK